MSAETTSNVEIPDHWTRCELKGLDWDTTWSNWGIYRVSSICSPDRVVLRAGSSSDFLRLKVALARLGGISGVEIIFT